MLSRVTAANLVRWPPVDWQLSYGSTPPAQQHADSGQERLTTGLLTPGTGVSMLLLYGGNIWTCLRALVAGWIPVKSQCQMQWSDDMLETNCGIFSRGKYV